MERFDFRTSFPLKAIRLRNFKSLKDTGFIDIKRLNLLFGKNGSGKSSFLLALRFLSQIISASKSEREKLIFNLNSGIDLGSYKQVVYNGDQSRNIKIDLIFKTGEKKFLELNHPLFDPHSDLQIEFTFSADGSDKSKIVLSNWLIKDLKSGMIFKVNNSDAKDTYELKFGRFSEREIQEDQSHKLILELKQLPSTKLKKLENLLNSFLKGYWLYRNIFLETGLDYEIYDLGEMTEYSSSEKNDLLDKMRTYYNEFVDESDYFYTEYDDKDYEDADINDIKFYFEGDNIHGLFEDFIYPYIDCCNRLVREMQKFVYIPHIRSEFPRALLLGDPRNTAWERDLIDDLTELLDPRSSHNTNLKDILQKLSLCDDIILEEHNGVFQLFIIHDSNKVSIADMSSGFKQVFPLLLKLIKYPSRILALGPEYNSNATLLIEQPELHIHPKLQADLLEQIILASTDTQLIIETHSETLLRKLQILIAREDIHKDDTSVYFFEKIQGEVRISKVEFDKNGFFSEPLPKGFFDESYELTEELLKVARSN